MFVGRENELETLERAYDADVFQMVVVYGRRRVGKTTLLTHFAQDKPTLFFTAQQQTDADNPVSYKHLDVYKRQPVCRAGLVVDFDEEEALRRFEEPEVTIEVDLHAGEESATMWTCDFSHEYVTINGDYRS